MAFKHRIKKAEGMLPPPEPPPTSYEHEVEAWRDVHREAVEELLAPKELKALADPAADALIALGPKPVNADEEAAVCEAGARRAEFLLRRRTALVPHPGPRVPEAVEVARWVGRMWIPPDEPEERRAAWRRRMERILTGMGLPWSRETGEGEEEGRG